MKPRIGFRGKIPSGLTLNVDLAETVSKIAKDLHFKDIHGAYSVSGAFEDVVVLLLTSPVDRSRLCRARKASPKLH